MHVAALSLLLCLVVPAVVHGAPKCAATWDAEPTPGELHADWRSVWTAVQYGDFPEAPPASDDEIRARLCRDTPCTGAGPWIIRDGETFGRDHLVAPAPGGGLRLFSKLGEFMQARCTWSVSTEILGGSPLHVRTETIMDDAFDVTLDGEHVRACDPTKRGAECSTGCFVIRVETTDRFFDLKAGVQVLSVTRPARAKKKGFDRLDEDYVQDTRLTRDATGAVLEGGGCKKRFYLDAGAAPATPGTTPPTPAPATPAPPPVAPQPSPPTSSP